MAKSKKMTFQNHLTRKWERVPSGIRLGHLRSPISTERIATRFASGKMFKRKKLKIGRAKKLAFGKFIPHRHRSMKKKAGFLSSGSGRIRPIQTVAERNRKKMAVGNKIHIKGHVKLAHFALHHKGLERKAAKPAVSRGIVKKATIKGSSRATGVHRAGGKGTGHSISAATRAKLSAARKGTHLSSATKAKISARMKGRKLSAATKAKIGAATRASFASGNRKKSTTPRKSKYHF